MGYKNMPWAMQQEELNTTEKMILVVLTMRANNKTQTTWISLATICREAGLSHTSRATARRALDKLRGRGLVSWQERFKDNTQTTHLYTVHWTDEGAGVHDTNPGAHNTYPPVLTTPGVGAVNPTDEEPNQEPLNEEANQEDLSWSTPSPLIVAPPPQAAGARPGNPNDPISIEFSRSADRAVLLKEVRELATVHRDSDDWDDKFADLADLLEDILPLNAWDHYIYDRGWTPPAKCAAPYEAGAWLNKLLHHVQAEEGPLTWHPLP